jgi:hypothetical protein
MIYGDKLGFIEKAKFFYPEVAVFKEDLSVYAAISSPGTILLCSL